ncbi:uncharacterized protein V1518DRAFT_423680 [Limtongia smithiae]|uniref:uncharacterized protein n=1 Tax=Limtongia smithiae TaxID=1125753 RepID=UPI0034CDFCAE
MRPDPGRGAHASLLSSDSSAYTMISFSKMTFAALLVIFPAVTLAEERPTNVTVCDYYAEKIGGSNTVETEKLVMALVLHSSLLGPYSKYNSVPIADFTGALVPTVFNGEYVDLRDYFNGGYASTNTGGSSGVAVNFWDDGGIEAAMQTLPGNGNATANQDRFFNHVYSYFGTFLGCSFIGSVELPAYIGKASMYEVHKFMDLNYAELGYFIDQAVRGLLSIGFTVSDAQYINATLNAVFGERCSQPAAIIPPSAGPQLQAICIADDCPLALNSTCSSYDVVIAPAVANATLVGNYTKAPNGSTSVNTSYTVTTWSTPTPSTSTKSGAGKAVTRLPAIGFTIVGSVLVSMGLL